ncbi:DUF4342 domain-containing protein [Desulfosporosinus sp. PR]|uniref:DUF4342 domain-containing protein n=1 Tax=Candidatus Desulfosporosinus nitrosoreducens TaxID=3401928 RepID=UPI0027E82CE9|nr:DUF4342 domain-containing protein [Desulfosporosinus sp. PR]MDQ7092298.1 DUF4342 domain-containing protein [Desulfosporosinus sp. PR]
MSEELWSELEKMDILRERMGIGYEEARAALNFAQGDVIKALDFLEKERDGVKRNCAASDRGEEIWESLKSKLQNFNHTKVNLKRNDATLLSLSAPLGLAIAYSVWRKPSLRMLALVGAVGAALNHFHLELDSPDKTGYDDEAYGYSADE